MILKGTPTVLANRTFEDHSSGIYDELDSSENGKTATTDLTNMAAHINVTSILWGKCMTIALDDKHFVDFEHKTTNRRVIPLQ